MSKIFDALQKASDDEGGDKRRTRPSGETPVAPVPEPETLPPPPVAPVESQEAVPALDDDFSRELANLRAGIDQIFPDASPRVLLLAGSLPGEGSSTVSARFAQLLAEDPRLRVALVDSDFRNRDDRPVEPVDPGSGLASVLAGRVDPGLALRRTVSTRLDVLPSEGVESNPYPLCSHDHVRPLLDHLRRHYHVSVLDGAPVLSAPETAVLAGQVDGVVLVVRSGRTKREVVQRSLDLLKKNRARVLGVVMNRQQYVIPEFIYRRL